MVKIRDGNIVGFAEMVKGIALLIEIVGGAKGRRAWRDLAT